MKTAWRVVRARPRSRSASKESTWRPKALRRTVDVDDPEAALVGAAVERPRGEQDHPGAGPEGGHPVRKRSRSGSNRPEESRGWTWWSTPLPGRPARHRRQLGGVRTSPTDPEPVERASVLGTSPWSASTPTAPAVRRRHLAGRCPGGHGGELDRLPASIGQPGLHLARLLAPHGVAQPPADLGHDLGVAVVGGRLHDRPGEPGRIRAFEDAAADEAGLGAELHDQRGVRRGGDPAGAEEGTGSSRSPPAPAPEKPGPVAAWPSCRARRSRPG